jgi:hypothetical protein
MRFLKSSGLAQELGIPYTHLFSLLRTGRLERPEKDSSGDYLWTAADINRARRALACDRRRCTRTTRQRARQRFQGTAKLVDVAR